MKCPECLSERIIKFGLKFGGKDKISGKRDKKQQYRCMECGRVTVNPKLE